MKNIFAFAVVALIATSCSYKSLETAQNVDLKKYSGTWYDIAHLPTGFQKGCKCTKAEYAAIDDGKIKVINSCVKEKGNWDIANGKATVTDETNSKLKVRFGIGGGKYWILDVPEDYSYALVGHPNRKYLWILSREKTMSETQFNQLVAKAKDLGFPTAHLERTNQSCGQD